LYNSSNSFTNIETNGKKKKKKTSLKCIITNGLSNVNFKFADTGTTLKIFIVRKKAYIPVKHCMTNIYFSICTLSDVE